MGPRADGSRVLTTAVEQALRAPSVHNTQPWRWRIRSDRVELHADRGRHLVATDPDGRDLVVSCGAALHHLLVALAAQGVGARVERLPDPEDSTHLATVTVAAGALPADPALAAGISRRRTDRRRMSSRQVPAELVVALAGRARAAGACLVPVTGTGMRDDLAAALADAAARQEPAPGYRVELEVWTRRYAGAHDGVPPDNIATSLVGATRPPTLRRFPHGRLPQPRLPAGTGGADDAAELLVVTTPGDAPVDRLRAGEATSAVLLAATCAGLSTTPLSQGVEVDATRRAIRRTVLHVPEHPQLVLRVGWPAAPRELPATPRRSLRAVLITP